ncbi:hypothetical protein, partial [Mesorhizobium sp. M4B.F.Ca.ET.214.01.1.1]
RDIALARYLDRQREYRQVGMPIVDFEEVALRLVAALARVGAAVSRRRAQKVLLSHSSLEAAFKKGGKRR